MAGETIQNYKAIVAIGEESIYGLQHANKAMYHFHDPEHPSSEDIDSGGRIHLPKNSLWGRVERKGREIDSAMKSVVLGENSQYRLSIWIQIDSPAMLGGDFQSCIRELNFPDTRFLPPVPSRLDSRTKVR